MLAGYFVTLACNSPPSATLFQTGQPQRLELWSRESEGQQRNALKGGQFDGHKETGVSSIDSSFVISQRESGKIKKRDCLKMKRKKLFRVSNYGKGSIRVVVPWHLGRVTHYCDRETMCHQHWPKGRVHLEQERRDGP